MRHLLLQLRHRVLLGRNALVLLALWPVQTWAPRRFVRLQQRRALDFYAVEDGTDLVIAGPPGAANSFARSAFLWTNPQASVASHAHVWSEVAEAAGRGKPVLLLLREPDAAVRSQLSRFGNVSRGRAMRDYARFYEQAAAFRGVVVVADFPEVTAQFGEVIRRVNERYGTSFVPFPHEDPAVVADLHAMLQQANGAVPTSVRRADKDAPSLDGPGRGRLRRRCQAAYDRWVS